MRIRLAPFTADIEPGDPASAGTTGAPITYLHDGKQYIVVAVGGRDEEPEWVALSLP